MMAASEVGRLGSPLPSSVVLATLTFFFNKFLKNILFIYLFFWLRRVLVAARGVFVEACGIFRCGAWASL